MSEEPEVDDEMVIALSDYLDGALSPEQRASVAAKIADQPEWKRAHDDMVETRKLVSGMHKARAPERFAQDVTDTIHKRSAGRFFGKSNPNADRWLIALVVIAVLGIVAIAYELRQSETGSLHQEPDRSHSQPTTDKPLLQRP